MPSLPRDEPKIYQGAQSCLYCGDTDRLCDEHIIPFGLGGRWLVPKGSCRPCAKVTSAFEGVVQRTMLGPLRMKFDMPTRRRRERPDKLPLKVRLTESSDWSFIQVDRDLYPFLVLLPILTQLRNGIGMCDFS